MREIKFRGKRIDNGEWLFGNIQVPKPPFDRYFMWDDYQRQIEVIPESVGQFTGRKDKNGNEIYEGDILKTTVDINDGNPRVFNQLVVWVASGFILQDLQYKSSIYFGDFLYHCHETIGNIHDNLELIVH